MHIVEVKTNNLSKSYLTLMNGTLKLTERELDLLALLLDKYLEFKKEGLKEPFLSKFVFSAETKKGIQKELGINSAYFQNIISSLSKIRGALKAGGGGQYTFHPLLIPRKEIGFKFG